MSTTLPHLETGPKTLGDVLGGRPFAGALERIRSLARKKGEPSCLLTTRLHRAEYERVVDLAHRFESTPCAILRLAAEELLAAVASQESEPPHASLGAGTSISKEVAP